MAKLIAWFKNLLQKPTEKGNTMTDVTDNSVTDNSAIVAAALPAAVAVSETPAVAVDAAPVSSTVLTTDAAAAAPVVVPAAAGGSQKETLAAEVVTYTEAELAKAKAILVTLGHDLGDIFDDVLALAKKA